MSVPKLQGPEVETVVGESCHYLFVHQTQLLENLSHHLSRGRVISTMFHLNLDRPTFAIPEVVLKIALHLDKSFGTATICFKIEQSYGASHDGGKHFI